MVENQHFFRIINEEILRFLVIVLTVGHLPRNGSSTASRGRIISKLQIALVRHHVVESLSLLTITKFRSRACVSGITHHYDVIDDVTK